MKGGHYNNNNNNSRPSPTSTLMTKREEKGGKDACSLPEAGLSSYLCRLCTMCQSVYARGWYPPHHNRMAGDITLKEYLYTLTLACGRQCRISNTGLRGDALAPLFYRYKLCTPLWALRRGLFSAALVPATCIVLYKYGRSIGCGPSLI